MTNAPGIKMLTNKHLSACVTRDLALSPGTAQLQPYTPDALQALGNASTLLLSCFTLAYHEGLWVLPLPRLDTVQRIQGTEILGSGKRQIK